MKRGEMHLICENVKRNKPSVNLGGGFPQHIVRTYYSTQSTDSPGPTRVT